MRVSDAFRAFERTLVPALDEERRINDRYGYVHKRLVALYPPTSDMPFQGSELIGSAARRTLVRPIDDLDLFAVFDDSQVWDRYRHDSTLLLYRVRDALAQRGRVKVVGARGQAVRLFYKDGLHVDVAPAVPVFDYAGTHVHYFIPAGDRHWMPTDPMRNDEFLLTRNRELGGNLRILVQLLKAWNRAHSSYLRSFHLEVMAQATFSRLEPGRPQMLRDFFRHGVSYLDVQDPAGLSGQLSSYLTFNARVGLRAAMSRAADRSERAVQAERGGRHHEAIKLWASTLGQGFPRP